MKSTMLSILHALSHGIPKYLCGVNTVTILICKVKRRLRVASVHCPQPHSQDPVESELEHRSACPPQIVTSALERPCREAALGPGASCHPVFERGGPVSKGCDLELETIPHPSSPGNCSGS